MIKDTFGWPIDSVRIFLAFLVASLLFCGCGNAAENPLTLVIGGAAHELAYFEKAIARFEARENLEVNIRRQTSDTDQRRQGLLISLQAHLPDPDVFLMDVAWVAQFAESGWLEPLDEHLENENLPLDIFYPHIVEAVDVYHGRYLALPVYLDAGLLYYRTDLLEKYGYSGPPETWTELKEMARDIQAKERLREPAFRGFVWQGAQYEGLICNFLEFAASAGGGLDLRPAADTGIATAPNIRALEFMTRLVHTWKVSPPNTYTEMKEEEVRRYFQNGKALFERNWPYAWPLHQSENSPVRGKVGIHRLPHFKGGTSAATLGGWHAGISRFSDRKRDAWRLLEFLVSYEVQKEFALQLGWNPSRRDVYDDPGLLEKLPHLGILKDVFDYAVIRPAVPYYTQVSEVLQKHLNKALAGESSARESLQEAERASRRILERYGGMP